MAAGGDEGLFSCTAAGPWSASRACYSDVVKTVAQQKKEGYREKKTKKINRGDLEELDTW